MCLDAIFGSKKKTDTVQNTQQSVTPTIMSQFQPSYDWLGGQLGNLGKLTPEQMVAALTPEQDEAIGGVSALVRDPTFMNRLTAAINGANSGTSSAISRLDGATPMFGADAGAMLGQARGVSTSAMDRLLAGIDPSLAASMMGPGAGALDGNRVATDITSQQVQAGNVGAGTVGAERVSSGMVPTNFSAERVGTSPTDTNSIMSRMSPYIQSVINPSLEALDLQQGMASAQSRARRAGQRAFGDGGERAAMMEQYLQGLQRNQVSSDLYQKGYDSAAALSQADEGRSLQAQMANQGAGLQASGLTLDAARANQDAALRAGMANQGAGLQAALANQSTDMQGQLANQSAGMQAGIANQGAALQAAGMNQAGQGQNLSALMQLLGMGQSGATSLAGLNQQGLSTAGNLGQSQQGLGLQFQGLQDARSNSIADSNYRSAGLQGQLSQGNAALQGNLAGQGMNQMLTNLNALMQAGGVKYDVNQRTLQAPWTQLSNIASTAYGAPLGQNSTGTMTGSTTQTSRPSLFDIASGVKQAAMGGMKFKHGGRVGYARGGRPYDEEEPPIPALVPTGYDTPNPLYDADNPANNNMRGFDTGAFKQLAALTDEAGRGAPGQALSADQPVYDPVAATDRSPIRRPWLGQPVGGGQEEIQVPSLSYLRGGPDDASSPEYGDDVASSSALMPANQMRDIMGVRMRDESPKLSASSPMELMANTISAMASPRKQSFMQKVGEFLNKDSTIDGFAMFSPGWAARRDKRDERAALTSKMAYEMSIAGQKHRDEADKLEIDREKNAIEREKITAQFGGGLQGQSEFAQIGRILNEYTSKIDKGVATTPDEDRLYNYAYSSAAQPKIFNTPDGRTITAPPIDLSQYPKPKGGSGTRPNGSAPALGGDGGSSSDGGSALPPGGTVLGTEPMTTVNAAATAGIDQAKKDIGDVESILFEKKPDGLKLKRMATASGGLPWSDARTARQSIKRAVEVLLRLRTGAAAPADEVENYTDMYAPSVFDTNEGAITKVKRLKDFYNEVERLTANSRSSGSPGKSPALRFDPAVGDFVPVN